MSHYKKKSASFSLFTDKNKRNAFRSDFAYCEKRRGNARSDTVIETNDMIVKRVQMESNANRPHFFVLLQNIHSDYQRSYFRLIHPF